MAEDFIILLRRISRLDASQCACRSRREPKRILATLLFTDIVDSTAHAEQLGDARWRALLEEQRVAVRREIARYIGTALSHSTFQSIVFRRIRACACHCEAGCKPGEAIPCALGTGGFSREIASSLCSSQ